MATQPKDERMNKTLKTLLVATALSATTWAALADDHRAMGGHHDYGRMDPAKMEKKVTRHLEDLKTKLKITPAQEASWAAFSVAMKPNVGNMAKRPDRAELEKLALPQRLEKMQALRKEHMAAMQTTMDKRDEAIKALYAVLSPEQKTIADAEHSRMLSRHHGKGERRG